MKKVTFIHAADLHLDSPMVGLMNLPQKIFSRLQDSTFDALKTVVDNALIHQVDFVIIAGDLFDGENRSIRAQIKFRKEMERLAEKNIPIYVVHGNHDHLDGNWTHLNMPNNVHVFSHEVEALRFVKDEVSVHLYGFSYPRRHVYDRMISHYKKKQGADFHIGILHGHLEGNNEHDKYAPFSLKDLLHKDFDYWALGHIHKRQTLHTYPPVIYSGNIQGRNRKETGWKGCYLVQLTETEAELQFIETSAVLWEEVNVDVSKASSFQVIYDICKSLIQEIRLENKGIIVSMTLDFVNLPEQDMKSITEGDLLDALQEDEGEEEAFVWISSLTINEKIDWNREHLAKESEFYAELFMTAEQYDVLDSSISTLYNHPDARRLLKQISEEEKREIAKEAERLLVNLLYKH
ncbi:DNA repair exonuclease [Bacillus sp. DTU_2020_1000418_1_SI_GHA_SEK_038]|uniref:metallophosphoesterase family protein n=1 Tax=Bacillus sp. DTU_2020_1000418_1_SI_GHA_SEK_038 TaxID=3077585 RepID=UPI0028E6A774|nr:DNA repair exonuclease [Bacillus sp. DTU_2020_1000418_1_SI_GHA_SEK_038]WNS76756.1 DNA repair exonuclease [Bacillus sp. DTU_2020_1000418_1_SI_GHA_SEK_038]